MGRGLLLFVRYGPPSKVWLMLYAMHDLVLIYRSLASSTWRYVQQLNLQKYNFKNCILNSQTLSIRAACCYFEQIDVVASEERLYDIQESRYIP